MKRERKTIECMIAIYCKHHHKHEQRICPECQELLSYANYRLDKCPLKENKPSCAKCPIHCYDKEKREKVKTIMRYAGPRMMTRHPILSLLHLFDGLKKTKEKSNAR